MDTTTLFVEILIAGTQCLVWLILLIINLLGMDWMKNFSLPDISSWMLPLSFLALSFAYTLGILMDRIGDGLFLPWDKKIQKVYLVGKNLTSNEIRFNIQNDSLHKHLDYIRSRLRIARSSALNFFMITIFSVLLCMRLPNLTDQQKLLYELSGSVLGLLLIVSAVYAWYILTNSYYKNIVIVYKNIPKQSAGD